MRHNHLEGHARRRTSPRHMEPPPESTANKVIRWGKTAQELGSLAYSAYQVGKVVAPMAAALI